MSSEIIWILAYNNDDGFQNLSFIYIYIYRFFDDEVIPRLR